MTVQSVDTRSMIIWCPDWPVVAAVIDDPALSPAAPIAVMAAGAVFACSAAARATGVSRGMRKRDAGAVCPELIMVNRVPEREVSAFEEIIGTVEDSCAAVMPIRPGLCAVGTARRFFGGEVEMAAVVAEQLVGVGVWDCRFGVADDLFTAELAARRSDIQQCHVVEAGGSADFLSGLGIGVLAEVGGEEDGSRARELAGLLRRLGVRRLGEFAALSARDVLTRFGSEAARWHQLARGADVRVTGSRTPPTLLEHAVRFETPLDNAEPVVFSSRRCAEEVVAELDRLGLVCPRIRIEVSGADGGLNARSWAHPRWFGSRDLIDRLHWQLQPRRGGVAVMSEPVVEVRFVPERTEALGHHADGLLGAGTEERIEVGISRLQGLLGPDAVLRPALVGGRDPVQRQRLSPWGIADPTPAARSPELPWPGRIPPPSPTTVFAHPTAARVSDAVGMRIRYTDRGTLTGTPGWLSIGDPGPVVQIVEWAGPWPAADTWWESATGQAVAWCQLVVADGRAWLAAVAGDHWALVARYD